MKMIDKFFGNIGISIFLVTVYRSYIFNLFCFWNSSFLLFHAEQHFEMKIAIRCYRFKFTDDDSLTFPSLRWYLTNNYDVFNISFMAGSKEI